MCLILIGPTKLNCRDCIFTNSNCSWYAPMTRNLEEGTRYEDSSTANHFDAAGELTSSLMRSCMYSLLKQHIAKLFDN